MTTDARFDVVIYEIKTRRVDTIVGRNLPMTTERT